MATRFTPKPTQPQSRPGNGGTTAPRGLPDNSPLNFNPQRPPGRFNPTGESKNTNYAKSLKSPGGGGPGASPASMPWDSAYETSLAGANAKYNNSLIGIGTSRNAIKQDYGIDAGFNDFAANPYSRAALLEQSYQRSNRGSQTSMGAAGHLYDGSLQNQLGYNLESRNRENDQLDKSYRAALAELSAQELAALNSKIGEEGDAGWKRVEAASNAPLDTSIAPAPAKAKPKAKPKAKTAISNARVAR